MERVFLGLAMALSLGSLWAIARHDLPRLARPSRRVLARVCGHRQIWDDTGRSYAAVYAFTDETGHHEVVDQVHAASRHPPVDTMIELHYPQGRPDLARVPRPALWLGVYGVLLGSLGLLAAKAAGLL